MSDLLACQGVVGGRVCGYLPQADPRERRGAGLYATEKGGMCAPCYNLHGNEKVIDRVLSEGRRDFWADKERRRWGKNELARPHTIPGPESLGSDHFSGCEIYILSIHGLMLGAVCLAVSCPLGGKS